MVKNPPANAGDAGSIPVYNLALPSVCSISSSPTAPSPRPLSTDLLLSHRLIKLCCSLFFRLQPISSPLYISQRITQSGLHLLPHFLSTNSLFNPYYSADLLITNSKDLHWSSPLPLIPNEATGVWAVTAAPVFSPAQ